MPATVVLGVSAVAFRDFLAYYWRSLFAGPHRPLWERR